MFFLILSIFTNYKGTNKSADDADSKDSRQETSINTKNKHPNRLSKPFFIKQDAI
jgi:hypothetical protein